MSGQYLAPVWDLSSKYVRDDSTSEFRWIEQRSTNDATDSNIRIRIDDNSSYLLLSEACVEVDFEISATGAIASSDGVMIPNAFSMFDSARLMLNDQLVQDINLPGVVHHMVHQHVYSKDYADTIADNQMFYPLKKLDHGAVARSAPVYNSAHVAGYATNATDYPFPVNDPTVELQYYLTANTGDNLYDLPATPRMQRNPKWDEIYARAVKRIADSISAGVAYCSVMLPLREIFPILGHAFNRVNRGSKIELQLNKTNTMERVFYTATAPAGLTFTIRKASVWVPRLSPELESSAQIEAQIATNQALVEPFEKYEIYQKTAQVAADTTEQRLRLTTQTSRVLRIYVGLQLDTQTSSLLRNPLQFDSQNLAYLEARVNNTKFPAESYLVNNTGTARQGLVRMLRDSHAVSGKTFDHENGACIDFEGFVNGAQRIYVLDLTQMDNTPFKKVGISDLEIRYALSSATTGTYTVNCIVVSEGESKTSMLQGKMLYTQH